MVTIEVLTPELARERRADLLSSIDLSEDELRDRAESFELSADELVVFERLAELDFLLGND